MLGKKKDLCRHTACLCVLHVVIVYLGRNPMSTCKRHLRFMTAVLSPLGVFFLKFALNEHKIHKAHFSFSSSSSSFYVKKHPVSGRKPFVNSPWKESAFVFTNKLDTQKCKSIFTRQINTSSEVVCSMQIYIYVLNSQDIHAGLGDMVIILKVRFLFLICPCWWTGAALMASDWLIGATARLRTTPML